MHSADIIQDLEETLMELEVLIDQTRDQAKRMDISPMTMMNSSGQLVMAPLIVAKSEVLTTLYNHKIRQEAMDDLEKARSKFGQSMDRLLGKEITE